MRAPSGIILFCVCFLVNYISINDFILAVSVAKRAIRGSAAKSRTPRNTRNTTLSTPQSTLSTRSRRKVQDTPISVNTQKSKSPPKKKTKSAKALNKQLDEAEPST